MHIKKYLIAVGLAAGLLGAGQASVVKNYVIDASQSYVSVYAPVWSATLVTPFAVDENGGWLNAPGTPFVQWSLNWALTKYQLSGSFQATTQVSGYNPDNGHLSLVAGSANLVSAAAASQLGRYSLIYGEVTYALATGDVLPDDFTFILPPGAVCACIHWVDMTAPTYTGHVKPDELVLDGVGHDLNYIYPSSPDIFGYATEPIANPGTPPGINLADYPNAWQTSHIVAAQVPEPGSLFLVVLGGLALLQNQHKRKKANSPMAERPACQ